MAEVAEHAVIAIFDDAVKAEQAAKDLMTWDKANDDVKLGAIGMVTLEGGDWGWGECKTKNFSARNTGKGAKVGMGLGVLAAVFSGGLTLIPTAVGGAVAGGAVGALSRKSLGLTDDELHHLGKDLEGGRAALLVMCDADEIGPTTEYLAAAGGKPSSGQAINPAELEQAAQDAKTPPAQP